MALDEYADGKKPAKKKPVKTEARDERLFIPHNWTKTDDAHRPLKTTIALRTRDKVKGVEVTAFYPASHDIKVQQLRQNIDVPLNNIGAIIRIRERELDDR